MNNSRIYRAALTGVASVGAAVVAAAPALAHVTVSGPDASRCGSGVLTFRVPNESPTGSATTRLNVHFPPLSHAETEPTPGWKTAVTRDDNHEVIGITWTAAQGGGIGPGELEQFSVLADGLPDTDTLVLPATQTYADGTVVDWDQQPADQEPEFPAPALSLAPAGEHSAGDDGDVHGTRASAEGEDYEHTARWLAGIAIVLASLGVLGAAAVLTRLRS